MSILDGMPSSEAELKGALEIAGPIIEQTIAQMNLTERQKSAIELMKEGLSLADIMSITKQERDALLVTGLQYLRAGDIEKARATLVTLYQLEPLDERVIYALASTYQLEGNFANAGKLYVVFLALDATNPDGFLRLGECFLGARELDEAIGCFETAERLAGKAKDDKAAAHAVKMLDIAKQAKAAAAP